MVDSGKIRLVRCPECKIILSERPDYSIYRCGGRGAFLAAKHKHHESASLPEKSNEGNIGSNSARLEDSSEKGFVSNDTAEVDVKSNSESSSYSQRNSEKESNRHEKFSDESREIDAKGVIENSIEAEKDTDEMHNAVEREQEDPNTQIGPEKGPQFSNRVSNWENRERTEMEGFWRKPRADMEGVRFSTSNHPDEGTSSSYSSFSYGEQWRNPRDVDGMKKVQHLEQDRAELLRKLDELKDQLCQSCEVGNIPKEKFRVDGRTVPPDPYSSSDTWFPDGSCGLNNTSRQFFGPDKHVPGPSYITEHSKIETSSSDGTDSLFEMMRISKISEMKNLPPKLDGLEIEGCKLPYDLLQGFSELRELYLVDCHSLKPFPPGEFPSSLSTLYVHNCETVI